jgi:hypothetical protein
MHKSNPCSKAFISISGEIYEEHAIRRGYLCCSFSSFENKPFFSYIFFIFYAHKYPSSTGMSRSQTIK